jgi:uncharacterized phage protein (TIGR02216 family)
MAAGLGMLGLPPHHFWAMTPKELDAALSGRLGLSGIGEPPSAGDFIQLMDRFPDQPIDQED